MKGGPDRKEKVWRMVGMLADGEPTIEDLMVFTELTRSGVTRWVHAGLAAKTIECCGVGPRKDARGPAPFKFRLARHA